MGFWDSLKFWVKDTYESRGDAVPQPKADPAKDDYWAVGRMGPTPESASMTPEGHEDHTAPVSGEPVDQAPPPTDDPGDESD